MKKNRTILDAKMSTQIARRSIVALIEGLKVPKEDYDILVKSLEKSLEKMKKGTSGDQKYYGALFKDRY